MSAFRRYIETSPFEAGFTATNTRASKISVLPRPFPATLKSLLQVVKIVSLIRWVPNILISARIKKDHIVHWGL